LKVRAKARSNPRTLSKSGISLIDGFVKSKKMASSVIPANPGSGPGQAPESRNKKPFWTPAFAGVTTMRTF
jgi:hypothetical protein